MAPAPNRHLASRESRTPVIIGVGQSVQRDLASTPEEIPTIESMASDACRAAIADTGARDLVKQIDTIAFVRLVSDSIYPPPPIFARCDNPPWAIASQIGANPAHAIYSELGGQAPEKLVHEASNLIAAEQRSLVLLTGAETTGAMKHALRQGWPMHEPDPIPGVVEDRNLGGEVSSPYEMAHGLRFPPEVYGALENAWRHERGINRDHHQNRMAEMLAPFSTIAAVNPYAQFPVERDTEFLVTPSEDNYWIADPYLKWHIAQDAVNQGAAIILASVTKAKELGVPEEQWVYPVAGADAGDKFVIHRQHLTRSDAMRAAIEQCLAVAGISVHQIRYMDLYSCFPCAIQFACDALELDPFSRQLTQTGGLPFFGGAGNNYTMHAIASLVDALRKDPGSTGMIVANGGYMSKDSAGLYSSKADSIWHPVDNKHLQASIDAIPAVPIGDASEGGRIETYSLLYSRNEPDYGYVICRTARNERFMARTAAGDEDSALNLIRDDPIGDFVRPNVADEFNVFALR